MAVNGSVYSEDGSGSGNEGEEQLEAIQSSVFEQYLQVCDEAEVDDETDRTFARGLLRVREYLSAGQDNTMCLICLGAIKPTEAIWQCGSSCFAQFHLPCIQEWARNQLATSAYKASRAVELGEATAAAAKAAQHEWGCPKCRFGYSQSQLPSSYSCYCGSVQEPEWDPWLAPHSCGELCGKQLPGQCSHSCLLLCHPGPCPPCPLLVDASCYCGKTVMKQRCGNNEFSCKATCGKKLYCGHSCPEICHPGECPPCLQVGVYRCACGAEQAKLPCWQADWHCTKPCNKTLACGRHKCEQVCHSGPCGPCPEEGERHCPCGKALYPGLKCDEKAPLCGGTCGKLLECGLHRCQERCHYGPCTKTCRELVTKTCRCGRTEKQVLCHTDVRCESKCTNMRACGRHACKRRCCDGNCPPCEEVCGRWLRCRNHKCPSACHSGPCRPCPLSQSVSCACGKTSYILPCGAEANATAPRCVQRCQVPPTCRHAKERKPHACHFGPCPPCRHPCGTALPCGHTCSSNICHDAHPPVVAAFQQPKPPMTSTQAAAAAAAAAKKAALRGDAGSSTEQPPAAVVAAAAAAMLGAGGAQQSCPPCTVPVEMQCIGGHVKHAFPCHKVQPYSCDNACGRPLACGHHNCSKRCHAVADTTAAAAEQCEVCTRPCTKTRHCSHPCPATCHPGDCAPCAVEATAACHCGKTSLKFPCWEYQQIQQQQQGKGRAAAAAGQQDSLCCGKPCHRQLPFCPHPCRAVCHPGAACPGARTCSEEVTVRCSCRRLKQKWPCHKVQTELAASSGGSRGYDGSAALKLLKCDAECAAQQRNKGAVSPAESDGKDKECSGSYGLEEQQQQRQTQQETAAAVQKVSSKKLSRAEREALAAQREADRLAKERKKRMQQLLVFAVIVGVLLAAGLVLFFGAHKALLLVDGLLRNEPQVEL